MSKQLTDGFREIIELPWSKLVELENSPTCTNFDSIITSLARAAAEGSLPAIKAALDRLDGKIATEIEVEYPKFYTVYPLADKTVDDPNIIDVVPRVVDVPVEVSQPEITEDELPTGSLRSVLEKMLAAPRKTVDDLIGVIKYVDKGDMSYGDPKVKSVIVAGLMSLVHKGRMSAVFEVFEQIDGKVAETYKMLGDDVYIKNFSLIAPAGAYLNEDGVYQIEADNTTNAWVARLEEKNNGSRR